jgi:hypothetical protein
MQFLALVITSSSDSNLSQATGNMGHLLLFPSPLPGEACTPSLSHIYATQLGYFCAPGAIFSHSVPKAGTHCLIVCFLLCCFLHLGLRVPVCEHALTFFSLRAISYPLLCSSSPSFIRTSYSRDRSLLISLRLCPVCSPPQILLPVVFVVVVIWLVGFFGVLFCLL